MAVITIHSDFGAQENKICHCFHYFPIYFLWSVGTRCHDLSFLNVFIAINIPFQFSSVQISHSVMSDSLRPHESQHARPPCLSPTPGVHPDPRPLSQWCHVAISSSVVLFSSCPQSLPAWVFSSESTLHMRWPKYWSFSFSIIPSKKTPRTDLL